DGKEKSGSAAFVPREKDKDKQLQYAIATLRGLPTDIVARKPEQAKAAAAAKTDNKTKAK
ncbi:MAG: S41 family peptidase, partial [Hyphomicrobiaceae bacterium]